jgi:hypothetical protein
LILGWRAGGNLHRRRHRLCGIARLGGAASASDQGEGETGGDKDLGVFHAYESFQKTPVYVTGHDA